MHKQLKRGSGFVIGKNGYIVTANHVVDGAEKIKVMFENDEWMDAKLIRRSTANDIAILKVNYNFDDCLDFADLNETSMGDFAYTIIG